MSRWSLSALAARLGSTPLPSDADSTGAVLDEPLPAALTGSHHGWLGEYQRWPVYSRRWAWLRLRPWGLAWGLLTAFMLMSQQVAVLPGTSRLMGAVSVVLALFVWFGVPLLVGPALTAWVRHQRWAVRRETAVLVLALLGTIALTEALDAWVRPPLKRALSNLIEGPGVPQTVVTIDFRLTQHTLEAGERPDSPAAHERNAQAQARVDAEMAGYKPLLHLAWTALYEAVALLLAGAWGLAGLRHERRELAGLRRLQELATAQAARREAETRLAVLQAQIEPHFLFNTLAGVRGAVRADPPRAVALIDRLVDYLRASIPRLRRSGDAAEATLAAQMDIVRAYLALMSTRLPRLSHDVTLPPALQGAHCPPLLLLALVENAVQHGIEPKIGPGRIEVVAGTDPDHPARLQLRVSDDGVGLGRAPPSRGAGLGLVNLRERLRALYGDAARLQLDGLPEGGCRAILTLPLENEHHGSPPAPDAPSTH